jgi:c(7)-type cytochrome triheme protein
MVACAPETRYRLLTTFVDDVPPYEEWLHPTPEAPPPTPVEEVHYRQVEALKKLVKQPNLQQLFTGERPAIEKLKMWDEVFAALPKSQSGGPDWSAAIAKGAIAPLTSLQPGQSGLEQLPLDVTLKGPMPVTYPHEPHTRWLACDNCHTGIFEMAAGTAEVTMKDISSGKYCGVCHGKVAFGTAGQCGRCHAPQEELALDVPLKGQMGVTFPHAPHTRWLPCERCHTDIFPMTGGQTTITMADIAKGKYCGACHGTLTFGPPNNCGRCHTQREEVPLDVTLKGDMGVKFPHAPHTRWLPCEICHTRLFPMAGGQTTIAMADISKGKYCGTCHGTIAFGTTDCARCHTRRDELALDVPLKGDMGVKFPHARHTRWLPCETCHTKIFPMAAGETTMKMADFFKGKYCGTCHGSIVFGFTDCARCHEPREELALDVTLKGAMPVTFPHAPHTRWLPCESCHTKLFPMAAGTTEITMDDLAKGKYCGTCHGTLAFALSECGRCHAEMAQ